MKILINLTSQLILFPPVLTMVFAILKLCGVITFSWWLVIAPLWMPATAICGTIGFILLMGMMRNHEKS